MNMQKRLSVHVDFSSLLFYIYHHSWKKQHIFVIVVRAQGQARKSKKSLVNYSKLFGQPQKGIDVLPWFTMLHCDAIPHEMTLNWEKKTFSLKSLGSATSLSYPFAPFHPGTDLNNRSMELWISAAAPTPGGWDRNPCNPCRSSSK